MSGLVGKTTMSEKFSERDSPGENMQSGFESAA